MDEEELRKWRKAQRENEENEAKANEIVKEAKLRLDQTEKQTKEAE